MRASERVVVVAALRYSSDAEGDERHLGARLDCEARISRRRTFGLQSGGQG